VKNRKAFRTHHKNETDAAIQKSRAMRFVNRGMKPGSKSSGASVAYCCACGAPVVDSAAGRKRHALRGGKCALAMVSGANPKGRDVGLAQPATSSSPVPGPVTGA
jgi:hypothetical protein